MLIWHEKARRNRPVKALVSLLANQRTPHNRFVVQSHREFLYSASDWFTVCALFAPNFAQTRLSIRWFQTTVSIAHISRLCDLCFGVWYVGFWTGYGSQTFGENGPFWSHFSVSNWPVCQSLSEFKAFLGRIQWKKGAHIRCRNEWAIIMQKSQYHPDWPPPLLSSWCLELCGATPFSENRTHMLVCLKSILRRQIVLKWFSKALHIFMFTFKCS